MLTSSCCYVAAFWMVMVLAVYDLSPLPLVNHAYGGVRPHSLKCTSDTAPTTIALLNCSMSCKSRIVVSRNFSRHENLPRPHGLRYPFPLLDAAALARKRNSLWRFILAHAVIRDVRATSEPQ